MAGRKGGAIGGEMLGGRVGRGGGVTVCLLSKQRAAAAGGERGTEQMEVETDKELGLVFRGWGTGTGQAQGERHNLDGRWSCPGGLYASPLLSLVPHRLDSGRLISVHVHIAACQSKVGQQIDVSFFFLGKKRDLDDHWSCSQLVGAVCPGFRPLCPPSTGTEHARSLGRAAVEACFRAYKNACPGPVWISTESFAECSSCQDSTFQPCRREAG